MAEPFKNMIGPALLRQAAAHLQRVWPAFDGRRFERLAGDGLVALELKQRVTHVSRALEAVLPDDFAAAADVLERSLLPARLDDDLSALRTSELGLAGWIVWPMTEFVARRGLAAPERALRALHAMTQRFSAEFAIRPFLIEHRELAFSTLQRWAGDGSPHVRRLVSEGSRPRLPWGVRLQFLVEDPSPTLPLLAALLDDPSEYVRRSVANHWNDIGKDHPELVADWVARHVDGASRELLAVLKRGSRTLVKQGHPRVLKAFGVGSPWRGDVEFSIAPKRVSVGGAVRLRIELRSTAARPQRLVVDYAVHHVRSDGSTAPKVRKGWTLELPARGTRVLEKKHSLQKVTTRRYHPGRHAVDLLVNGKVVAQAAFVLQ
jgi:3-methyladenine DNA glycosylase AlkC